MPNERGGDGESASSIASRIESAGIYITQTCLTRFDSLPSLWINWITLQIPSHPKLFTAPSAPVVRPLFVRLIGHRPAVTILSEQTGQRYFFSRNESAPSISHRPSEKADDNSSPTRDRRRVSLAEKPASRWRSVFVWDGNFQGVCAAAAAALWKRNGWRPTEKASSGRAKTTWKIYARRSVLAVADISPVF
jgi:hypothetical protein